MVPSPEWSIVSFPAFPPSPIAPIHPDAVAEALPVVVEVELVPDFPPTVKTKFPANPPEMYVRSFLYSGDKATACTGRAKFRSCTSFTSTSEATHTFPSIDDVAMYIAFAGVRGMICGVRGFRGVAVDASDVTDVPRGLL